MDTLLFAFNDKEDYDKAALVPVPSRKGKRLIHCEAECGWNTPGSRWVGLDYCIIDYYAWVPIRLKDENIDQWLDDHGPENYATKEETKAWRKRYGHLPM
jgi:hypothetical protein